MDKQKFSEELKDLMTCMTGDEIEHVIEALVESKNQLFSNKTKEINFKLRRASIADGYADVLLYGGLKSGKLLVHEATLLSEEEYKRFRDLIPEDGKWWLRSGYAVTGRTMYSCGQREMVRSVRPVLVLDGYTGDLVPGDVFNINKDSFMLLSDWLAIRTSSLSGSCTYITQSWKRPKYECSLPQFCVNGWYRNLIESNNGANPKDDITSNQQ